MKKLVYLANHSVLAAANMSAVREGEKKAFLLFLSKWAHDDEQVGGLL